MSPSPSYRIPTSVRSGSSPRLPELSPPLRLPLFAPLPHCSRSSRYWKKKKTGSTRTLKTGAKDSHVLELSSSFTFSFTFVQQACIILVRRIPTFFFWRIFLHDPSMDITSLNTEIVDSGSVGSHASERNFVTLTEQMASNIKYFSTLLRPRHPIASCCKIKVKGLIFLCRNSNFVYSGRDLCCTPLTHRVAIHLLLVNFHYQSVCCHWHLQSLFSGTSFQDPLLKWIEHYRERRTIFAATHFVMNQNDNEGNPPEPVYDEDTGLLEVPVSFF